MRTNQQSREKLLSNPSSKLNTEKLVAVPLGTGGNEANQSAQNLIRRMVMEAEKNNAGSYSWDTRR